MSGEEKKNSNGVLSFILYTPDERQAVRHSQQKLARQKRHEIEPEMSEVDVDVWGREKELERPNGRGGGEEEYTNYVLQAYMCKSIIDTMYN